MNTHHLRESDPDKSTKSGGESAKNGRAPLLESVK